MGLLWVRVGQLDPADVHALVKRAPVAVRDSCGQGCHMRGWAHDPKEDHQGDGISVKDAGFASYVGGRPDGFSADQTPDPFGSGFDHSLYDEAQPSKMRYDDHDEEEPTPSSMIEHDDNYQKLFRQRHRPDSENHDLHNFVYQSHDAGDFWKNQPVTSLSHDTPVHATQPYVFRKHLNRYIHDRQAPTNQMSLLAKNGADLDKSPASSYEGNHHPLLVKHQGKIHAIEGHHRVSSDILSQRPITGRLYDADAHPDGLHRFEEDDEGQFHFKGSKGFRCPECYTERSECCHGMWS